MKKKLILFALLGILVSCSKDEKTNSEPAGLIGLWRLTEQLADPGDGSGTFRAIQSDKTIEFYSDEVVTVQNGSLCEPYTEELISSGTYSLANKRITTNCQDPTIASIGFELKEGNLILNFISNEGFSQKFEKIK